MNDLPVGSLTIAREQEEVTEEIQALLAPEVEDAGNVIIRRFRLAART
jgi:hypothetical protein